MTAWSYSRLSNFETCPRKYAEISVYKRVRDEDSPASAEGQKWHDALAARIKKGTPLPLQMRWMEPLMESFMRQPGEKYAEEQLAITSDLKTTGWFAKDVWCRSIFDFTLDMGNTAITIDWKTGRHEITDFTQQRIASAVLMLHAPELQEVKFGYYWTQKRKMTPNPPEVVTRADIPKVFDALKPRLATYNYAHEIDQFPPRQNDGCRWCPVKTCQFNKSRK